MQITLSPVMMDGRVSMARRGRKLIIDGQEFDLSAARVDTPLADHGCPWIVGPVERVGGVLHFTLILPHGHTAPKETCFPAPVTVTKDGPLPLPPFDTPAAAIEDPPQDDRVPDDASMPEGDL